MKTENKLAGTGLIAAVASSLCCITPILALVAGTGGLASSFAWIGPFRPWLIGVTLAVLAFAWYQKFKPQPQNDCNCEQEKPKFMQGKTFLTLVTAFALLMLTVPNYANVFSPESAEQNSPAKAQGKPMAKTVAEFTITGMTCAACEGHVTGEVNKLQGIEGLTVSYAKSNAVVEFDKTKTSVEEVQKAIKATGYKVTEVKIKK
ncbi:mercuric transport protein MerTP [Rufibacter hautae]|uniref:Mercuric transport protein MerT n=1 Tax=Rufibacter hautae TaxID=2595005 RepID=A0A5B6TAG1_9BACT|nr:mercuric transport protein MerTP [Rufibacter hautae]KAA3435984.1 mercuric transport protein MerTP [Rufibacter hautae]